MALLRDINLCSKLSFLSHTQTKMELIAVSAMTMSMPENPELTQLPISCPSEVFCTGEATTTGPI